MNNEQARRIKNILEGDNTSKVNVSIGYEKEKQIHNEGDIWEENGKRFTLKNGIKITHSKLSEIRHATILPLVCPKCGQGMNKRQDKMVYFKFGMCFDCVIKRDTKLMEQGEFQLFEENILTNNMKAYSADLRQLVTDYINNYLNNHFVTEFGDIEDWKTKANPEEIQKVINEGLEEFEKAILKREEKDETK